MPTEAIKMIRRDIRVDRVGLVKELIEKYQQPLIDDIKKNLTAGERAGGDLFESLLVSGTQTEVDPEKFFQAWESGKMTRAQFISALKISTSRAKEILGEKDLSRISAQKPTSPCLRVTRIKGVQIELVDAIRQISDSISSPFTGQAA